MSLIERTIPPYVYRKSSIIFLISFTAAFALLFINLYEPFNSKEWYDISTFEYFLYSSLLTLTGMLVVVISRLFMYHFTKKRTITYWEYGIWIFAEIFFMSALYAFISYSLNEQRNFWIVLNSSARNTSLVLLLPYAISHLYFALQEKNRQVKAMKIITEDASSQNSAKIEIVPFYDDKGEMRFSVKKDSLLYIESADNYVSIWYIGGKGISKYFLRNTLKNIEENLAGTKIIRCHRSFMVNFDKVKIAKRTPNGIVLDLDIEKVPEIPVSKLYGEKVTELLLG